MVDQILETDNSSLGKRTLYRYTLSNHLGSSTVELDDKAWIISYEEYHPYGTSAYRAGRNVAEVKLKRYRYTGMERDEESGLEYHSARYYARWLGRWVSCDPIGTKDGFNIYIYCRNQPNHFKDSNGTIAQVLVLPIFVVAAIFFVAVLGTPTAQENMRKSASDLLEWLSSPKMSPFVTPFDGDPKNFSPEKNTKPDTKPAKDKVAKPDPKPDPQPDPKPDPKPPFTDVFHEPKDKENPKPLLNLDAGVVQSYATNPLVEQAVELLAKKYTFVITDLAFAEAEKGLVDIADNGFQFLKALKFLASANRIENDADATYIGLLRFQNKDPKGKFYRNPAKGDPPVYKDDAKDLIIFGTGVKLGIPTITADGNFVKKIKKEPLVVQPQAIVVGLGTYEHKSKP